MKAKSYLKVHILLLFVILYELSHILCPSHKNDRFLKKQITTVEIRVIVSKNLGIIL